MGYHNPTRGSYQNQFEMEHNKPFQRQSPIEGWGADPVLRQPNFENTIRLSQLEKELKKIKEEIDSSKNYIGGITKIQRLPHYNMSRPIDAIVQPDDTGFIARTVDLPLYAHSDDSIDAIEALKYEIENLYEELLEDDNFTEEWLRIKRFLIACIENES